MVSIPLTNDDDPRFLALVTRIVMSSVRESRPTDVFIVRIDHWFDHKWCAFAGNLCGAVAFYKPQRLTIPPFIPGRVVSQEAYTLDVGRTTYCRRLSPPLHRNQRSAENLSRFIGRVSESGVFIWFSGDTAHTEHGSIMVYSIHDEMQHGWYASFQRGEDWQFYKVKGLSRAELANLIAKEIDEHVVNMRCSEPGHRVQVAIERPRGPGR